MKQSRLGSLIEATINTVIGFIISWIVWVWVAGPVAGLNTTAKSGFIVTTLMTITSVLRSYFLRRGFDWYHHRRENGRIA